MVFALGLLVPLVAFACMDPAGAVDAYALQYATIKQLPRYIMTGPFVAAVLCLCVERVCYTLVWCCPKAFGEFCSKHNLGAPVDVIVRLFGVNKFFQLLGFAHLYLLGGLAPPPSLFALGVGAALVVWGQALNVGIYRAIGKAGVYYGYKFGVAVPWCTGFPFTLGLAHPQYLGSAATAYGCVLLSLTADHVPGGYGGLAHAQALLYAHMARRAQRADDGPRVLRAAKSNCLFISSSVFTSPRARKTGDLGAWKAPRPMPNAVPVERTPTRPRAAPSRPHPSFFLLGPGFGSSMPNDLHSRTTSSRGSPSTGETTRS